jgi:hypothetical protein
MFAWRNGEAELFDVVFPFSAVALPPVAAPPIAP